MSLTLSSVLPAVSTLSLPICLPTQAERQELEKDEDNPLTLQRDSGDEEGGTEQGARPDPLIEEDRYDDQLEWPSPEEVHEHNRRVKSVDVVGEEVDHLTHGGLAQCRVGEPERLPVDEGAAGHSDLHADVRQTEEVGMVEDGVESGHGHHSAAVEVGLGQGHSAVGSEVLDHPAWKHSVEA